MAQAEISQTSRSLAQPCTPPGSPHEHTGMSDNIQYFVDMVKGVVDTHLASAAAVKCMCSHTSLYSSAAQAPPQSITIQDLEKLILKLIGKDSDDNIEVSDTSKVDTSEDNKPKEVLVPLLAFKEITEIWDEKACKYTVVETPKTAEIDNLDQYAFLVRGRVDKKTKETTHHVDVKSSSLLHALRKVLHDVPGLSVMEEQISIDRNILYSFLPEIESYHDTVESQGPTSNEHVKLLVDHVKSTYADVTQRLAALLKRKEITYDLLWALFKPNTLAYTTCQGTKKSRCIRYVSGEEKSTDDGFEYFHIKGTYLDFDGKALGKAPIETAIVRFSGSRPINSLEVFPLHHHDTKETIINELAESGRKFCSLAGVHHRQYKGRAFQMKKGKPIEITINSKIMVDAAMFQDVNPNYTRPSFFKQSGNTDVWAIIRSPLDTTPDESSLKKGMDVDKMSDEDFQLCSPTVLGFSLEDKLWLEFAVADITKVCWDESIYDQLAIPPEQKAIIRALTTQLSGQHRAQAFDDFVKGKGRGLNILLYGPPGVGKTMTAEALSELLHKPLFTVSAADFSHEPAALDKQLSGIFDVADLWDALLLLDEADAPLRKRSDNSLHNSMVSVFLRKLEYFKGIMILTTNRVADFDDAVQSRIHVGIPYGPLGHDTRKRLWDSFLKKASTEGKATSYSTKELDSLARHILNGRQIKNAVRAAHALAKFDNSDLCMTHVQTVIDVGKTFERDFKGTGNIDNMNGYL